MNNDAFLLPPAWGRIEVGEASDDCRAPKRGFPLPTLPQLGGGEFGAQSFICDRSALRGGAASVAESHR
jgi:hypothetical protein